MDTEKICRTCLGLTGPFLSIFDDASGNTTGSIADMLRNFTNTKPRPADKLPEKVCLTCISEINRCYSFKQKCEQSNRTLRQLLPNALPEEPDRNSVPATSKPPVSTEDKFAQTIPISEKKKIVTVSREVQTLEEDQRKNEVKEVTALPMNKLSRSPKLRRKGGRITKSAVKVVHHDGDDDDEDVEEGSDIYEITRELDNDESASMMNKSNSAIILHMPKGDGEFTEMILNESTGEWHARSDIVDEPCNAEESVKPALETINTEEYKFTIYNNENGEEEFAPSTSVTTRNGRARKRAAKQDTKASPTSTAKNTRAKRSGVEKAKEIVEEMEIEYKKRPRVLNSKADDTNLVMADKITTEENPIELKHLCEHCNAGFALHKSLVFHQRYNNCTRQSYKCDECGRVFISEEHLHEHRSSHEIMVLPCAECSETFATKEKLSRHMIKRHKRSSKNKCNVCQKVFTMLSALRDHMRIHTGEKPFICEICNKGFTQSANMRQHMFRHSNTKRFQCDQCNSSFVTKAELMAHTRSHTGDKPYQCDVCESKFTTSSSLIKHKRKHTGEIPYACEMCPMRFTALNVLKNHRRTHTGEKPYACPHCPRRFTQNGDCVLHQRTHQRSNNSYFCHACNKNFKTIPDLKRHLNVHNKNDKLFHLTLELNKKAINEDEYAAREKAANNVGEQEFLQMTMDGIC